jgi:hypothetical protein
MYFTINPLASHVAFLFILQNHTLSILALRD